LELKEGLTKLELKLLIHNIMEEKINYNDIPVEFCRNSACCSLAVVVDEDGTAYCNECGCTKFDKEHIDVWKEYYFQAHGRYLLD